MSQGTRFERTSSLAKLHLHGIGPRCDIVILSTVLKPDEGQVSPRAILEVLDRIERLVTPQCKILAERRQLLHPKDETVVLHSVPLNPNERLELDDAVQQVIFAMRVWRSCSERMATCAQLAWQLAERSFLAIVSKCELCCTAPIFATEATMSTTSPSKNAEPLAADKLYAEISTDIRESDNASFRLLGLVPLVSGTALIGLVLKNASPPSGLVRLLAVFSAGITLGLFRWELRNLQTCSWLIKFAYAIQDAAATAHGIKTENLNRPTPPQGIGKTAAEKLIYTVTAFAWLALPFAIGTTPSLSDTARRMYYIFASLILVGTLASVLADPHVAAFGKLRLKSPCHRPMKGHRTAEAEFQQSPVSPLSSCSSMEEV